MGSSKLGTGTIPVHVLGGCGLATLFAVVSACGRIGYDGIDATLGAAGAGAAASGSSAVSGGPTTSASVGSSSMATGASSAVATTGGGGVGGTSNSGGSGTLGGGASSPNGGAGGAAGANSVGTAGANGAGGSLGLGGMGGNLAGGTGGGSVDGGTSICGDGSCVRAFVSAAPVQNPIGSAANADAACSSFANARGLGGSWKAWISDSSSSASGRLVHSTVPYRLLNQTVVANDWDDLVDGSIGHAIDVDETGIRRSGVQIWTATDTSGAGFLAGSCQDWTNDTASNPIANIGRNDAIDQNWSMTAQQTCDQPNLHLYCLEQGPGPASPGAGPGTCPSSISFTSPVTNTLYGSLGGTPRVRLCPQGEVNIGYSMFEDKTPSLDVVSGLVAECGKISVVQSGCQLTIGSGTIFPLDGVTGNSGTMNRFCPANQMVVAVRGRAGQMLDQLSFGCAPLTLSKVGSSYQAAVGAITWLAAVGGTGGAAFTSACPAGEVFIGADIHAGTTLNAFSSFCATPILLP